MDLSSNRVALLGCDSYSQEVLLGNVAPLLGSCGVGSNPGNSDRVLIKPNLITARRGLLACTEAAFILAAVRFFVDSGYRVTVGDSPAFGTARSVLQKLGIADSLRYMGVGVSDFNKVRYIVLPGGVRAGLAADALDCDLLVNLPRVKAHVQLGLTMAVKNFFGCLAGMRKSLWHMIHGGEPGRFESLILELLAVLPNSVNLVDGITAMHCTGPTGGRPFPLHIMACSANPVAVDRALLEILGIDPLRIPLADLGQRQGIEGADLGKLDFPLLKPWDLAVKDFEIPGSLDPVRFDPCRFVKNSLRRILPRMVGRS